MRRQRYPRYKEPVFSKKFTLVLLVLALAAAGFAVYVVFFSHQGIAGINDDPFVYEPYMHNNEFEENTYNNNDNDNESIYYDDYYTNNGVYHINENDIINNNDTNINDDHTQNEPYIPSETNAPEESDAPENINTPYETYTPFVLLTTVDNSLLPWHLKLVNRYNFLEYDFEPSLSYVGWGHYFDTRAYRALLDMIDSARSYGLSPIIASSYRSVSHQTVLFNNRIQRFVDIGYEWDDAFEAARRIVAYPGTSEHNLGLAVDIVALSYQNLTANQATTPEGIWLAENSYRYGFVLRYPYDKQHITNIIFEPWHFRYVGVYAATEMFYRGLVLEEYVSELLAQQ